jgi:hypothetical protein
LNALIIPLLKIGLISGFVTLAAWIAVYSRLARWWRNPVGRSLVYLAALNGLQMAVLALSLFLHFNRLTSLVAAWIYVVVTALSTPVMVSRTVVWIRMHKARELPGHGED